MIFLIKSQFDSQELRKRLSAQKATCVEGYILLKKLSLYHRFHPNLLEYRLYHKI